MFLQSSIFSPPQKCLNIDILMRKFIGKRKSKATWRRFVKNFETIGLLIVLNNIHALSKSVFDLSSNACTLFLRFAIN